MPDPSIDRSTALLLSTLSDGVLRLTMNRPDGRNTLSDAMLAALQSSLDQAAETGDVRAIVIAGTGPGFCGGHDLKEMTSRRSDDDGGRAYFAELFNTCSRLMQTIVGHPKVIIAEVQGTATAAGCQLVAACDLAVASTQARFGVNGINSGLFCSTPMVALSRNISRKRAMELLCLGEMMSAAEALEAGLVNKAVAPETLRSETDAMAARLASRPSGVLKLGKQAFYRQLEMPLDDAYRFASQAIVDNMMMDDAREGIGAFIEKARPTMENLNAAAFDHDRYGHEYIRGILTTVKSVAIVGASTNDVRPSYFVLKYLIEKGYEVFPINPGSAGQVVLGCPVYATLSDVPDAIDMVDIFRGSEVAGQIVDDALALDPLPKVIWMQLTVRNDPAARKAEAAGLKVVMNRCPKMEYGKLSGEWRWIGGNSGLISSRKQQLHSSGKVQSLGIPPAKSN